MEQIKISIKQKDYDGSHNKYFKSLNVQRNDLEDFFKTFNYSLITWKSITRKKIKSTTEEEKKRHSNQHQDW